MTRTRRACASLLMAVPLAVLSCGTSDVSEPVIEDPPGLPAATTIDILLGNFEEAYTTMDYEEYEKLLDESYRFVPDPDDIHEDQPGLWSRIKDLESTRRMFYGEPDTRNRVVQNVSMEFIAADPVDSDEGEGWKKIVLSTFALELEAIQMDNGETWFLRTRGGYSADIFVKQTDGDRVVWKIVQIVDRPPSVAAASATAVGETTWAKIKAGFR